MSDDGRRAVRSTTGEPCPLCGKRGSWSSLGPERIYCPPAGHTVHRITSGPFRGTKLDSCPLEFFIPPDWSITI